MPSPKEVLVRLLAGIDFATRYYAYCDSRASMPASRARPEQLVKLLDATGFDFTYVAKERVFVHKETHGMVTIGLDLSAEGAIEMGLSVKTSTGRTGSPYCVLAEMVAQSFDPAFIHDPSCPRLPFHTEAELAEAIKFGMTLFEDARRAILAYDGWT